VATVVQRTAIGSVLILIVVGLFAIDEVTGHGYGVILLATGLVTAGLREYAVLARGAGPVSAPVAVALMVLGGSYVALRGLGHELDPRLHLLGTPLALVGAYALFFSCLRGTPSVERFRGLALVCFGFFYVAFLGSYAVELRYVDPRAGTAAFIYVVAIAKGTDIAAFFSGKAFGRTKLVPSVSPGKTTAGYVGAVCGAVLITILFVELSALGDLVPLPLAPGVGIVMALVVISGDLLESFMKRSAEVKDSARMLPGFGGVLDIVDSVIIAAPAVYYLLYAITAFRTA
jgi:phosphatidate cytidylyltransferase